MNEILKTGDSFHPEGANVPRYDKLDAQRADHGEGGPYNGDLVPDIIPGAPVYPLKHAGMENKIAFGAQTEGKA